MPSKTIVIYRDIEFSDIGAPGSSKENATEDASSKENATVADESSASTSKS